MMQDSYENPLISIVTVCFNSAATIEMTIKSVLEQTYQNYEYIIIDGASSDNTVDIIKRYLPLSKGRMQYISEKDSGIYNAMNKGIKRCSGVLIGIINSDDYYSQNTLELVAERYKQEKYKLIVINGEMERVTEDGEIVKRYHFSEKDVENKNSFGHPAMFAARAVYDKIGYYDESYKLVSDADWQYRALEDPEVRYVICHEVFNHMREGGASDNYKYRWKWFHERIRLRRTHKKGTLLAIYGRAWRNVLVADIKHFFPKKLVKGIYKKHF